jgi:hypothetical protein
MTQQGNDKGSTEDAAERRQKAFALRRSGVPYRAIGKQLGISEAQAHRDVQAVLARLSELELASVEEYRVMELARLDRAQAALATMIDSGEPAVIGLWIKVSESRRKLLGLDAPTKIAQTNPDGTASAAYAELRAVVLALLSMEQRLLLADALDKVLDVTTPDRPATEP